MELQTDVHEQMPECANLEHRFDMIVLHTSKMLERRSYMEIT